MALTRAVKNTPRPNDEKLRELILLISELSQSDPKFGAIKLNKLLFHADFSAYLTYGEPITGQKYFKLPQGPAPRRLKSVTESMKKSGDFAWQEISYFGHTQKKPIALRPADPAKFSGPEINLVHQTVEKFWTMSATEISEQSHLFLGWKAARSEETIPYSTALISGRGPTDHERKRGLALQNLAEKHLRAAR